MKFSNHTFTSVAKEIVDGLERGHNTLSRESTVDSRESTEHLTQKKRPCINRQLTLLKTVYGVAALTASIILLLLAFAKLFGWSQHDADIPEILFSVFQVVTLMVSALFIFRVRFQHYDSNGNKIHEMTHSSEDSQVEKDRKT